MSRTMMSSASAPCRNEVRSTRSAFLLVSLLMMGGFLALVPVPLASAADTELGIISGNSPMENAHYSKYDGISLSVNIINTDSQNMDSSRLVRWHVCSGDHTSTGCPNSGRVDGTGSINNIAPGEQGVLEFTSRFFPDEQETGIHTVEFKFAEEDGDSSDDSLIYNFWVADYLFDIDIAEEYDMRPANHTYAIEDGDYVYNSNTSYPMYVRGVSNNCFGCTFDVEMGWRLVNSTGDVIASNSSNHSGFSEWGEAIFNRTLPDLFSPQTGTFTLEIGVFNSSATDSEGSDSQDLNSFNDLYSATVYFNDTLDLRVESMFPAYQFDSVEYFYGEDAVQVEVVNIGYLKSNETQLYLEAVYSSGDNQIMNCTVPILYPRQSYSCTFNLTKIGSYEVNATLGAIIDGIEDYNAEDNWLFEVIDVIAGPINPSIIMSSEDGIYDTGGEVELIAQVSSTAARPLNYSWLKFGFPMGEYGKVLKIPADELGMGDHDLSLIVIDALGNDESAIKRITVYNRTNLDHLPVIKGEALTRSTAALDHEISLPQLNIDYNLPENLSPLMLFEFDVVSTDPSNPDPGMESMEFDLNLSSIIPESVPYDSLHMYSLPSINEGTWQELVHPSSFHANNNTSAELFLSSKSTLLLVGDLPPINVSAENVVVELLPGGYTKIDFTPTGDLDNVYFNGWRILKRVNDNNAPMRHPSEATDNQEAEYERLYFVTDIDSHNSTWYDPVPIDEGHCASYALVPIDRQGITDWSRANTSGWNGSGVPDMSCGDAIPPTSGVSGFSGQSYFTNESSCWQNHHDWDMCYVVNLTWDWPDDSEARFHMYRVEVEPDENMNLSRLQPIGEFLSSDGQEKGWWNESSYHGIRPYHTYYYILAPIDEVGNVNWQPDQVSGSVERVQVDEEFWDFNQHLIPEPLPPEEPPLGVEYLGELNSWVDDERFQIIGLSTLVIFCINLIALPIILKKRKIVKLKMAGEEKWDGDDEMEDDLASFFS